MYIYKLIACDVNENVESYQNEYLISDKLYDNDEFKNLCNKVIEEVKETYKEVTNSTMKQHLILHYGFKELPIIQSYYFDEEYK